MKKKFILTLAVCTLIGGQAYAEYPEIPAGASVETSPTTTTIRFSDGSFYQHTPTTVEVSGPQAMIWYFENNPRLKPLSHIFEPADLKSFEKTPVGGIIYYSDGSYTELTPTGATVTGGLATAYENKVIRYYYGSGEEQQTAQSVPASPAAPQRAQQEAPRTVQAAPAQNHNRAEPLSLINTELRHQNFAGKNLSGSSFTNVDFYDVDLTNVDFSNSSFTNVEFHNGDLRGASFSGASLTNVDFFGTKLKGVDFTRASTVNVDFSMADYTAMAPAPQPTTQMVDATQIAKKLNEKPSGDSRYHDVPSIDLTINFEFDSDQLQQESWQQVSELAKALKSAGLNNAKILIEGHTDSDGSDDYNMGLSYRRAGRVMSVLTDTLGIEASRLSIKGYGETRPVADNGSPNGRAQNRRVTIVNLSGAGNEI